MDRSLISPSISSEERNSAILNNDTASQLHTADSASGSGHRSQSTQPSAFINVDVFATTQSTTPIIDSPSIALSSEKVKPSTKKSNVQKTKRNGKTGNNRGERMNFELDEVIRNYTPEQFKTCQAYDVGGVNILNKKPVDSKTTLDKIKRRRETHNRVERRRRDRINQLIDELIALLPKEEMDLFKSHRADVLRATVAHIQSLNHQNTNLKHQIELIHAGKPIPPPAIITALAPIMDINENNEFTDDEYSKIDGDNDDSRSFKSGVSSPISYSSHEQIAHSSLPNPERLSLYPYSDEQEGEESSSDIGWKNSSSAHVTPLSDGPYSPGTPSVGIPVIVEPPVVTSRNEGQNSKRMDRQRLPRLQLVPPPIHQHWHQNPYQHHQLSNTGGDGSSPLFDHDSIAHFSPSYSGSSSSTSPGPYSSSLSATSSSMYGYGGGTSPHSPGFPNHDPPSPYSPYSPHSQYSPHSPNSPHGPSSTHAHIPKSPILTPWSNEPSPSSTRSHLTPVRRASTFQYGPELHCSSS